MELPENYKSWIEFAKECIIIQQRHYTIKIINIDNSSIGGSFMQFNIDEVKAKAFDEIMGKCDFSGDLLDEIRCKIHENWYTSEMFHVNVNSIFDLLFDLKKDKP